VVSLGNGANRFTMTPGIGPVELPTTPTPTPLLPIFVGYEGTTTVNTGAGVDTFEIRRLQGATTIFAGAADDILYVGTQAGLNNNDRGTLNEIIAELTVHGEAGNDVINLDDSNEQTDNGGALTHEYLTTAPSLIAPATAATRGFFGLGGRLHYLSTEFLNLY